MANLTDTQSHNKGPSDPASTPPDPTDAEVVLRSEELFSTKTEIVIVHNGERYRLRLTRRGKLILQK